MIAGILSYLVRVEKQTDNSKDSAWESIFQTTWTSILLRENWVSGISPNTSLGTYCIQMDPSVTERSRQSGKKPVLCRLWLLSTIIGRRQQSDLESAKDGKIA